MKKIACMALLSSIASIGYYNSYYNAYHHLQPNLKAMQPQEDFLHSSQVNESLAERVAYSLLNKEDDEKKLNGLEQLLIDSTNSKYDYLPILISNTVSAMAEPVYKITSETRYESIAYSYDANGKIIEHKVPQIRKHKGSCVILKKSEKAQKLLVLTAGHVLKQPAMPQDKYDEKGRIVQSSRVISYISTLVTSEQDKRETGLQLKVLIVSPNADIALAECDVAKKDFGNFSVSPPMGDSDELRIGHTIYLVGFPLGLTKIFSNGIVLSTGDQYMLWDDTNFYINSTSTFGNSGGPAYAMRDGQPELVGILSWKINNSEGLHGPVRINHVKPLLTDERLPPYFRE